MTSVVFFSCNTIILYIEGDDIVQNVTKNTIADAGARFILGEDFFDIKDKQSDDYIFFILPSRILTFLWIYSFSFSCVIPKIVYKNVKCFDFSRWHLCDS